MLCCVCLFADSPSDLCVFQFRPFFAHHSSSVQSAIGWCSEPKLEMWWNSEEFESSPSSTTWADTTRAESKVIRRWETTANSIQECNNIAREEPWQSKMRKEKHTKFHVEGFVWLFYSVFFSARLFFFGNPSEVFRRLSSSFLFHHTASTSSVVGILSAWEQLEETNKAEGGQRHAGLKNW